MAQNKGCHWIRGYSFSSFQIRVLKVLKGHFIYFLYVEHLLFLLMCFLWVCFFQWIPQENSCQKNALQYYVYNYCCFSLLFFILFQGGYLQTVLIMSYWWAINKNLLVAILFRKEVYEHDKGTKFQNFTHLEGTG